MTAPPEHASVAIEEWTVLSNAKVVLTVLVTAAVPRIRPLVGLSVASRVCARVSSARLSHMKAGHFARSMAFLEVMYHTTS